MAYPPGGEQNQLIEAIRSLQARRDPLDKRLRAIEENKGTTAPQIYERVKRQTEDQLAALRSEEAMRRTEAMRLRDQMGTQRASIERRRQDHQDSLEELKFRNTLGEFTPDEFTNAEAEQRRAIADLDSQLATIQESTKLLAAFLDSVPMPRAVADSPIVPAAAVPGSVVARPPTTATQPGLAPAAAKPMSEIEALFGSPSGAPRPAPTNPAPPSSQASRPPSSSPASPARDQPAPSAMHAAGVEAEAPRQGSIPRDDDETTGDVRIPGSVVDRPAASAPAASSPAPAASDAFHPTFVIAAKDDDRGEEVYELADGQTLIGRAPENDVILLEESVSRRHARLIVEGGACKFEDLGSANGSYLNGERLRPREPRLLKHDDAIKLGQLLARYRAHRS